MDSEICRQIVEGAFDSIVVADASGTITHWNAGAVATFGHSATEAVGRTLDLIVPEAHRARHWAGYYQVMERGTTRYGQALLAVPALHRDGRRLSIELRVTLLRASDGTPNSIAAIIRDVTERWHEDRALRRRLHELEDHVARLREAGVPPRSSDDRVSIPENAACLLTICPAEVTSPPGTTPLPSMQ